MNIRRSSEALSEAEADALLSGRALAGHDDLHGIIGLMRTASTVPAPTPNAALAALLESGFAPLPVESAQRASRWGRWGARVGVATAAAVTVTLGAATANALPASLQTAVANVVGAVTPLQLPRPVAPADNGSTDSGGAVDDPAGVPGHDDRVDADNPDASTAEPAEVTPTASPTPKAPAVVAPPRRPAATATGPAEPDEPDTDERDTDEPDTDGPDAEQPDTDEPDADDAELEQPDTNEPDADADQPEAPDADAGEVDDEGMPDADEPELDVDGQPEPDADGED